MAKVFISHKTNDNNNLIALALQSYLEKKGHDAVLDIKEFHAGDEWANDIYDQISDSDVLVVMVTEDAASQWVQREIDFARGCRVKILPVVVRADDLDIDPALHKSKAAKVMESLAIIGLQFVAAISPENSDYRFIQVEDEVRRLVAKTRAEQGLWVRQLTVKWDKENDANPRLRPPKVPDPSFAIYTYIRQDLQPHPCQVHLAAGDMTQIPGIKVLVNSENVFMQMQRVFAKPASVSSTIRLNGARTRGQQIEEDTIQKQLDDQLFGDGKIGVPVSVGDVFITSAGSQNSQLRKFGVDYILHVATLDAKARKGESMLEEASEVTNCVKNCFAKLAEINEPVTSVIFPMLGTGYGGLSLDKCTEAMIDGIKDYLKNNPTTTLKNIHLAAYKVEEIEAVETYLDNLGPDFRRISPKKKLGA